VQGALLSLAHRVAGRLLALCPLRPFSRPRSRRLMASLTTPYVTPKGLKNSASGVNWDSVPSSYQGQGSDAAVLDICWRSTSKVDSFCNTPVRATINTEQVEGPDFRLTVDGNGARIVLSRPPVISVSAITTVGTSDFLSTPRSVTAGQWRIINPLIGEYGTLAPDSSGTLPNSVRVAPGWIDWSMGRRGWLVAVTYTNGWPHSGVTAACAAGSGTLTVDDCTGMAGMELTIKDGSNTEVVEVATASATSGAGVLTLTGTTQYAHNPGVIATTLPGAIELAAIKFCTVEALTRGTMTISAPSMPSSAMTSDGGGKEIELAAEAEELLTPFKRVI